MRNDDPAEIEEVLEELELSINYDDAPEWLLELCRKIVKARPKSSPRGDGEDLE